MRARQMIVSILMMVVVVSLVNYYIGLHFVMLAEAWWPRFQPVLFWPVFAVIVFAYAIGIIRWPKLLRPFARLLKVIGSYYFAIMEFAVILLPLADLVYIILALCDIETGSYVSIAGGVTLGLLASLMLWGSRNAWSTVIRKHVLHVDKHAGEMKELRVAVASDLHLGNIVGNRHLRRLVKRINAMKPDIILLPGDVLDDSIEPFLRNRMSDTLMELQARDGVYAVLGNHEYYGASIPQYVEAMKRIGIQVLQDETVSIGDRYYVAGRKDRTAESASPEGRLSVASLVSGLDMSRPVIMMDHQPYGFNLAAAAGVDVLLCGHTHRGQIAPNHWITKRLFELDWGYMRKDKMHVAVSSGYGTWGPPIRLASRSEIVELKITFG